MVAIEQRESANLFRQFDAEGWYQTPSKTKYNKQSRSRTRKVILEEEMKFKS